MKLGIIGGAGAYASALLYQKILDGFYEAQRSIPEIVLLNYPFTRALRVDESKRHQNVVRNELQHCIDSLAGCGVDQALIACNTLHLFYDRLDRHEIQFTHLPQMVTKHLVEYGVQSTLLLATPTTIQEGLYQHPRLMVPTESHQQDINQVIDNVLAGILSEEDSRKLSALIHTYKADVVVLGCTDLPVLHHHYPIEAGHVVDPLQLYVQHLVQETLL